MNNCDLFNADCLEIMENVIHDNSIDLILTSPPYDELRNYNGSLLWNLDIFKKIAFQLVRVLKEGGVIVWVVNDMTKEGSETGTSFTQALYFKELGLNLHDTMVWIKDGGGAIGSRNCYTQNFEYMFIFTKGHIKTVNIIADKPNASFGKNRSGMGRRKVDGTIKREVRKPNKEYSRRNNYWYIPVGPNKDSNGHPAVFPLSLAIDHILSWSNEGDIVFDPFLGSGTTGVAAKTLNRAFIGIEKDPSYFKIAEERLSGGITDE